VYRVCALCYELHQRQLALAQVESEFSELVFGNSCSKATEGSAVIECLSPRVPRSPKRGSPVDVYSPSIKARDVSLCVHLFAVRVTVLVCARVQNLTLCRILVIVHSIHDIPFSVVQPVRLTPVVFLVNVDVWSRVLLISRQCWMTFQWWRTVVACRRSCNAS
jgi:hypothetical protein